MRIQMHRSSILATAIRRYFSLDHVLARIFYDPLGDGTLGALPMDMTQMISLIRSARTEGGAAATVAIDMLLQAGYPLERAQLAVSPAALIRRAIERRLDLVQGRCVVRTLDLADVVRVVKRALGDDAYGWEHGGYPTASSYGHSWTATVCAAVRMEDGRVLLTIDRHRNTRQAQWGISANTDRATRPSTRERNLATIRMNAEDYGHSFAEHYGYRFTIDMQTARALVESLEPSAERLSAEVVS